VLLLLITHVDAAWSRLVGLICCHQNHHTVACLQVRSGALDILQRCVMAAEKFAVPGDVVQVGGVVAHQQVPVMLPVACDSTGGLVQYQLNHHALTTEVPVLAEALYGM
jgi:hypothetical protein